MSPTASPFKFPNMIDREGDHQMIDPSSLRLPNSTPSSSSDTQDSITPQPTANLDNPTSTPAFWSNANLNGNNPITPLWSFQNLDNSSNVSHASSTTPSTIEESSNSGSVIDSTHTTPASANTKFNYPFSARPGITNNNISNNMLFRNNDLVQTPSTDNTQWSTTSTTNPTSAMDHTFMSSMPPPPPNTASQSINSAHYQGGMQGNHGGHTSHMSLSGALTGLSPMLAGFTTASPTFDQNFQSSTPGSNSTTAPAPSPMNTQITRPGGPIRTYSANAAIPQNQRKRSNTLMTLASSTPSNLSGGSNSYPYPSPRFPASLMNNHNHTHIHPANLTHPHGQTAGNRLNRQPSVPILTNGEPTKRVFHPSPATAISPAIGVDMNHMPMSDNGYGGSRMSTGMGMAMPFGYSSMPMGMGMGLGMGMRSTPPMDPKPPRFKPTKEQLEILIKSYDENKNPDGPAREALAKRLGPDVRPKTLQIWFQNRRSKSRAKERDANLPKSHHTRGGSSSLGHRSSPSTSTSKGGSNKGAVDIDALRGLIHDDDPNLIVLPIQVLSIANWTRFLMPGTGISHPDLAAALRFPPTTQPSLYLYVVHQTDTFRIEIPINTTSISNLQSVQNPSLNTEAVAISFELSMSTAKYAAWQEDDNGPGMWNEVGDFTGGETNGGGKCELTGDKEVLLSSFSRVQQYLATQNYPTSIGTAGASGPAGNAWKFPPMSTSSHFNTNPIHSGVQSPPFELPILGHLQPAQHFHQRQRSSSEPELKSSSSGGSGDSGSGSVSEFEMTSKAMNFGGQNDTSGQVPLPSTATASSIATGHRTEFEEYASGNGYPSFPWQSMNSPHSGIPISMASGDGNASGMGMSNWGFPLNSSSTSSTMNPLHTPISATLNPSSLNNVSPNINNSNVGFNQFATLNSGVNRKIVNNNYNDNQNDDGMIGNQFISSGNQSEDSSEMDLGTPPFEFEDKSNNTTNATTNNENDNGIGIGKVIEGLGGDERYEKGKERFLNGLENIPTTDL